MCNKASVIAGSWSSVGGCKKATYVGYVLIYLFILQYCSSWLQNEKYGSDCSYNDFNNRNVVKVFKVTLSQPTPTNICTPTHNTLTHTFSLTLSNYVTLKKTNVFGYLKCNKPVPEKDRRCCSMNVKDVTEELLAKNRIESRPTAAHARCSVALKWIG